MKSIAVVLIIFGMVATGIGVYFIRQSQIASTTSQAYEVSKPLPRILDSECDYMYGTSCPLQINGDSLVNIPMAIEKVIRVHASPSLLRYSEPVSPELFESLGTPSSFPIKATYSVPEIIARISVSSNINYKLLLTVFATQGEESWSGQRTASSPFGRQEISFAEQFAEVVRALKASYQGKYAIPVNYVTNRTTTYLLDSATMNTASRSLYLYFVTTSDEEEFTRLVAPASVDQKSFKDTWYELFPEDAVRK